MQLQKNAPAKKLATMLLIGAPRPTVLFGDLEPPGADVATDAGKRSQRARSNKMQEG